MTNEVAKSLKTIGIVEFACGVIVAVILLLGDSPMSAFAAGAVVVTSFITCMIFEGFAEIINLLQSNNDVQRKILKHLEQKNSTQQNAPQSVLQDIESNLPQL